MIEGPGCFCLIVKPAHTDTYLSGGSIPLLTVSRPLLLVDSNLKLPSIQILAKGTDVGGSILLGVRIVVRSVDVYNTPCHGQFCDHQSLLKGDTLANRCACIQMTKSGKVAFAWGIEMHMHGGNSVFTTFLSKSFTNEYFINGELPINTTAESFTDNYIAEDALIESAVGVMDHINGKGGFNVILWVKRGEVLDQGVDQPNNGLAYNAARTDVESSKLNHHLVRLFPAMPEAINMEDLKDLQFNANTGLQFQPS